jgi:hypothetical protein
MKLLGRLPALFVYLVEVGTGLEENQNGDTHEQFLQVP